MESALQLGRALSRAELKKPCAATDQSSTARPTSYEYSPHAVGTSHLNTGIHIAAARDKIWTILYNRLFWIRTRFDQSPPELPRNHRRPSCRLPHNRRSSALHPHPPRARAHTPHRDRTNKKISQRDVRRPLFSSL